MKLIIEDIETTKKDISRNELSNYHNCTSINMIYGKLNAY